MACLDVPIQTILGTECIGDSLPKIMGNFNTLGDATCDLITKVNTLSTSADNKFALKTNLDALSANPFIAADTSTIDLTLTNRTLSASVINNSVTNSKLAFDGGSLGFRNKIINGNFDIWQRGTSFTSIGAGTFTADRWTTSTATTTLNKNIERQIMSVSDLPYTEAGLVYCVRASYTSGTNSTELVLSQPIELIRTGSDAPFKAGKTYTLSYYARCQSNNDITWSIQSRDYSSSGLNAMQIAGAAQSITGSWTRYSHTFTMTSPNTTNTCVTVAFSNRTTPANTYIDITGVQLEEGSVATPFEQRPIGTELALCQRYFHKSQIGNAWLNATWIDTNNPVNNFAATYWYPTYMRTVPTVTQGGFIYRGTPSNAYSDGTVSSVDTNINISSIRVVLPMTPNAFGDSTTIRLDGGWSWNAEL